MLNKLIRVPKSLLLLTFFVVSFVCAPLKAAEEIRWEKMIDGASKSILSIRVDGTRAFDTDVNNSVQATGFVVDAERGIVLTNRHVVKPGPAVATGMFLNREEIELIPIYRDPIHDFGFFKYDPKELSYNEPPSLDLRPDLIQIGREIRVIGNDGGEQLSILTGTIARLDRPAPSYGRGKFNDFNTFYIQAASSTSGGSSGAPVINIDGKVVALNAGANMRTASSFYLPLDRVVRALELLREDKAIPRGTLQTTFSYKPYDELTRLGLSDESERQVREHDPDAVGLLSVVALVPDGPAEGALEPGDILLKLNGEWVRHYVPLEKVLDDHVGKPVVVTVERGGEKMDIELTVQDLNEITPSSYVDVGGALLHDLSYQLARNFNIPVEGVYVARVGYMLGNENIGRGNVITSIAGKSVKTVVEAEAILKTLGDGERFNVRYFVLSNPRHERERIVTMDRRWFSAETCHRDDSKGLWMCDAWPEAPANHAMQPASTTWAKSDDSRIERLSPSIVVAEFDMPYPVGGIRVAHYIGAGLIVDAKRGLVMVDRNTVPTVMGDVRVTFAGSLEVPGKVEFIHPFHNMAIISYDPALIGDTVVKTANLSKSKLSVGNDVWLVGPKNNHEFTSHKTTVASVDPLQLPVPSVPTFRETNMEVIRLTSEVSTVGGVLSNKRGDVLGIWSSFEYQRNNKVNQTLGGIPAELVKDMVESLDGDLTKSLHTISTEMSLISLAKARKRGLPNEWAKKFERNNLKRRDVLYVGRLVAGSPAAELLKEGDMILAIDNKIVNTYREIERAAKAGLVNLTISRAGEIMDIALPTEQIDGRGMDRVVGWAGAVFQMPYREMATQRALTEPSLYVSWTWPGSPASHYGLGANLRLIELDGEPITDIDSFLELLPKTVGSESVRLKVLTLNGRELALTLKPDGHYWPTFELVRTEDGWQRNVFENM
ncbi:trypsin-like peptidase domain-containing protein [Pseudomonadota bacterium]